MLLQRSIGYHSDLSKSVPLIESAVIMALTREHIEAGLVEEKIREAEHLGLITRLPPEQRQASKYAILEQFGDDELWLFGYGSLMWNPCIDFVDRQPALLHGYHRNFCLRSPTGRGTPECPGLMLALKPGGACRGIAYRIEPALADTEFDIVWNREMVSGAYQARMVRIRTPLGPRRAATFVANRQNPRYLPAIESDQAAMMIARAEGWLGSCAEYLFNTVAHLDELGVGDGPMHELCRRVHAHLASAD